MNKTKGPSQRQRKLADTLSFVEDLKWLLDSKGKRADLSLLRQLVSDYEVKLGSETHLSPSVRQLALGNLGTAPDKQFLVGVLPKLLKNPTLFSANKDISDFAEQVLDVSVPRSEKRSRYELIGLIVSEVDGLGQAALRRVSEQLAKIVANEAQLVQLASAKPKDEYFSWNDVIRRLQK